MRGVPPFEILQQVTGVYFLSRSLQIIADFGVADALGDEPATASDLARERSPGLGDRFVNVTRTDGNGVLVGFGLKVHVAAGE